MQPHEYPNTSKIILCSKVQYTIFYYLCVDGILETRQNDYNIFNGNDGVLFL